MARHLTDAERRLIHEELVRSGETASKVARRLGIRDDTVFVERRRLLAAGLRALYEDPVPTVAEAEPADPVELRRYRDRLADAERQLTEALRRADAAEQWRSEVMGLMDPAPRPRIVVRNEKPTSGARTVVLALSDIHYGEKINPAEIDGLNSYSVEIARKRLGRYFSKVAELCTEHWVGEPPEELVIWIGGDLISGDIHPELQWTNEVTVPVAVKEVGEHLAGGLLMLRDVVGRPIRVYRSPGNHARLTMKPHSKLRTLNSLDVLAVDFCEIAIRNAGVVDIEFHHTASPDVYFRTYDWWWLANHGDTMGGRGGGTGFIGPMAAIVKGHRKLIDTSLRAGRTVHYVLTGHYHTTGRSTFGWANGSVVGYGEFARDIRADPEPSKQWMLVVHPQHGVISESELFLGHPSEGSLYLGPSTIVRPTYEAEEDE